jgi:hypothetical protein
VKLDWPAQCACCFGEAETTEEIFAARKRGDTSHDVRSWTVPYCRSCARHCGLAEQAECEFRRRQRVAWQGPLAFFLLSIPLAIGIGLSIQDGWPIFFVPFAVVVALFLAPIGTWRASARRERQLEVARRSLLKDCTCLTLAVVYAGWNGSVHTLGFTNEDFAEAFFQANEKKIVK